MRVYLASRSEIKLMAVEKYFLRLEEEMEVKGVPVEVAENPEQPVGELATLSCALRRLRELVFQLGSQVKASTPVRLMAIESGVAKDCSDDTEGRWQEIVQVVLLNPQTGQLQTTYQRYHQASDRLGVDAPPDRFFHPRPEIVDQMMSDYEWDPVKDLGIKVTVGSMLATMSQVPADNWMESLAGVSRKDQIYAALFNLAADPQGQDLQYWLRVGIRCIQDFPKPGVVFQDIFPLFSYPVMMRCMMRLIYLRVQKLGLKITHVTGPELRGTLMAQALSLQFGWPMIPIRKAGKLPPPTIKYEYDTEYSSDVLEIPVQEFPEESQVLVVDDVLATGGSLKAVCDLLESQKLKIGLALTLTDVEKLRETARKKLDQIPYQVLIE